MPEPDWESYRLYPRCPFCFSFNLTWELGRWEEGAVFADVICEECGKQWRDLYKMVENEYEDKRS